MKEVSVDRLLKSKYRIGDKLFENNICSTYQGTFVTNNTPIIIKIYKRTWLDSHLIKKLREKVPFLSRLSHPKVAALIDGDYGWQGFYFIRELAPGKPLTAILNSKKGLSAEEAVEISIQIAQGLEAAHKLNILHGGLKPANVIIEENKVKVTDFGLENAVRGTFEQRAQMLEEDSTFMSPEEIQWGISQKSSDIYRLGLLMFTLVCKAPPFRNGSNFEIALAHLHETPVIKNPSTPKYLEEIILKCLEKDPLLRFTSAKQIQESLKAKAILEPKRLEIDLPSLKIENHQVASKPPAAAPTPNKGKNHQQLILLFGVLFAMAAGIIYAIIQAMLGM